MSEPCEQCKSHESRIDDLETEKTDLQERVTQLEKALDDVMGEINFARVDLDDAEKIIGENT